MKVVRLVLAALSALILAACSGGSVQAPDFQGVLDTLTLSVPAGKANPALGQTVQLDLKGHYTCQPGVSCPSTDTVAIPDATYTASPSALATVDNTGLVTTKGEGTVTITATKDGVTSNSVALQVGPAVVTSVEIHVPNDDSSGSASGAALANISVPAGGTQDIKVYAIYSNSPAPVDVGSNDTVAWTTTDATVADVSPTDKAKTTVTAKKVGTSPTVTATVTLGSGGTKTASVTVNVGGAVLTGIQTALSPATASIATGSKQQFKVIGTYSNNTTAPIDPSLVTWTSSDATVATVDATGLATGTYAGASISGTATITATLKSDTSKTATAALTVLGSNALGCTELFPTASVATKAVSTLCDPLGSLLGLSLPLCGVDNPERVVDADPDNYARMFATVGLLFNSYVSLTVTAPTGTTFAASQAVPRRAGFIVTNPVNALVKADLLSQFSVTTLLNGQVQQTTDNGVYFTLPGANAPAYFPAVSFSVDAQSALTVDLLSAGSQPAIAAPRTRRYLKTLPQAPRTSRGCFFQQARKKASCLHTRPLSFSGYRLIRSPSARRGGCSRGRRRSRWYRSDAFHRSRPGACARPSRCARSGSA